MCGGNILASTILIFDVPSNDGELGKSGGIVRPPCKSFDASGSVLPAPVNFVLDGKEFRHPLDVIDTVDRLSDDLRDRGYARMAVQRGQLVLNTSQVRMA